MKRAPKLPSALKRTRKAEPKLPELRLEVLAHHLAESERRLDDLDGTIGSDWAEENGYRDGLIDALKTLGGYKPMRPVWTLADFDDSVRRTINNPGKTPEQHLAGFALGLAGEAGEFVDLIKKHLFHDHPLDTEKARLELGDVLWYVAACAQQLGLTLDQIATDNHDKRRRRYPGKFDPARSLNRGKS